MKKIFLILILSTIFTVLGQDKKIIANKIDSQKLAHKEFIGRDQYGALYFNDNNVLYKLEKGKTFEYKNVSLGKISKVDIENPLKIVLFYDNFNTVILLDNQLSETQKILFTENSNPIIATAIGNATQNRLWLFNELKLQIELYDYLKNSVKTISTPISQNIIYYQSDFNNFSWIDSTNHWYSCNLFGNITAKGKLDDFDWIQFINENEYIYSKNKSLFIKNRVTSDKYEIKISEKTFEKCYYKDQILSIFTSEGIINYKIKLP